MFILPFVFIYLFLQFSACFHSSNGIAGFVFGFQKLCFCRCGVASRGARGGEAHPWLVSVGARTAGALVSERHVVTAATPVYGMTPGALSVTLGVHDRCGPGGSLNSSVAAILVHPAYSAGNHGNDIALLRLRHAVSFSAFIAPICLPLFASEDYNKVVSVPSWSSGELACTPQTPTLPLLRPSACADAAPPASPPAAADTGCLGPGGAKSVLCEAEAGAPVLARWSSSGAYRLLGILHPSAGCAGPARYTRVIEHALWIRREIREDCQCL